MMVSVFLVVSLLFGQWQQHVDQTKVTIDGAVNPELVPEYAAWQSALEFIDSASNLGVPSVLIEVLTKHEQALLIDEAHRVVIHRSECLNRATEARAPLAKLEATGPTKEAWTKLAKQIDARMWEVQLACRWDTLHARDRLLATVNPEGGMALTRFVEDQKTGLKFTTTKGALDRFRQPR
jgi:hypothetical protein